MDAFKYWNALAVYYMSIGEYTKARVCNSMAARYV
jgi:hypothetical protein